MSYQRTTGTYIYRSFASVGDYVDGAAFTSSLINAIVAAGWTLQQELTAEVSVSVITIVHGVVIVLKGDRFGFWWPPNDPISGTIPVEISQTDTLAQIVAKFGTALLEHYGEDSGITAQLNGSTITIAGFPRGDNGKVCSIEPAGFGAWDGTTGVAGEGFIWKGGAQLLSAEIGDQAANNHLILQVRFSSLDQGKRILIRPTSILNLTIGPNYFDGLKLDEAGWNFVGSDLQIVVWGDFSGQGSFLIVSNMAPLIPTIDYCHFAAGPLRTNVGPDGGSRTSFQGAFQHYWADVFKKDHTGIVYVADTGEGTIGQNPDVCYPGYARGIAVVDKLDNRIGGNNLDLKKEDGTLFPFEPFIAFCTAKPADFPDAVLKIMGQIRDAMIYSTDATPDDAALIDDDDAQVLISQSGTTSRSKGCLAIRISQHILP